MGKTAGDPHLQGSAYRGLNVLVTGADGFIGSHLTERLVMLGAEVTALALYNSFDSQGWLDDLSPQIRRGLHIVRGDVRDKSFVRRLLVGQEIVFHLAALIAIPHSYVAAQSYVDTNVVGTLNVLEAARDSGAKRVIHTSTSEVYGTAIMTPISEDHPLQGQSPYSASKIGADMMAEAYARSFDLPVAILRPFNAFGPRQSERAVIPAVIRQFLDPAIEVVQIGETTTSRDFTYVDDTVAAFLAIGASSAIQLGCPYNAGSGESITVGEIVSLIGSLIESRKPVRRAPERLRPPKSEVQALLADSTRLSYATGWAPRVSLREGLECTIAHWRDRFARGRVRGQRSYAT